MDTLSRLNLLRGTAFLPMALALSAASGNLPAGSPGVMDSYGKLPLSFEANRGQADPRVRFLSRGRGYTLFLTDDSAVLSLHQGKPNAVLRMKWTGGNRRAAVAGADPLGGKSNYFIGREPAQWRGNVPTYGAVKYTAIYPGIDLVYHGNQRLLEYDFVVAPGGDPSVIDIRFQGARNVRLNGEGDLVIGVGDSEVAEHAPVVYQESGGRRQSVAGRYALRGRGHVGFSVANYDHSRPLVIDPPLVFSTYLGGSVGYGWAQGIAVDVSGNSYVVGITQSPDFPTTSGAFLTTYTVSNSWDIFVTKLDAQGSALVYSTYLGAAGTDLGLGIALDAVGNAYVTGAAGPSFPTTPGAYQTACGTSSSFVTELNTDGSALVYSAILCGCISKGIAVDATGNAYITGRGWQITTTPGALQPISGNGVALYDAFVSKLNATGSALAYSTYLGGLDFDEGNAIAVDTSGNAYITGNTTSTNFPTTTGAFATWPGGEYSSYAFVSKLNTTGSALVYSTYLGGGNDVGYGLAIDSFGNAYVTGSTTSCWGCGDFPITPGAFQATRGSDGMGDAFVSKLNTTGSALVYSTYLGGNYVDVGAAIAVDALGNAYVAGGAASTNFPTTQGAFQPYKGNSSSFVSKLSASGSALVYSTYFGGETGGVSAIAVDAIGNVYVVGQNQSSDFPTTPGAFQTTFGGGYSDAFVSKLSLEPGPVTTADLKGASGINDWYVQAVTVALVATSGSGTISTIYYSLDGGRYQAYGGPFTISTDGVHQLLYYSVDTAGRQEAPHGQTVKIDTTKPVGYVAALPATATSPNFSVQWSGTDTISGVADYTVYVSDNGGAFVPWLSHVSSTQANYSGSLLHTYALYSAATDNAGNVEIKTAADTITHVPQMPGDANGDGRIDCADVSAVKASFGKRVGQTGFDARADISGDGTVDVRDLALVSQKLFTGTRCP